MNPADRLATAVFVLNAVLAILPAGSQAQTLSPMDAREAARFDSVVRAVSGAGYSSPAVVGHGMGAQDSLFALLATRNGRGFLLAALDPADGAAPALVDLEDGASPADLGIHGITFGAFLDSAELIDMEAAHRPFMLETTRSFATHYVLRRSGAKLSTACVFEGSSSSSTSKGVGSIHSVRTVTVERVAGATPLTFDIKTEEETREVRGGAASSVTSNRTASTARYRLSRTGMCIQLPTGAGR